MIELGDKKAGILKPQQIAEKKLRLMAEKTVVMGKISLAAKVYDQNQTGVFEFLSNAARENDIKFESLIPNQSEGKGEIREIGFQIETRASFHKMGSFLNNIETGILNVRAESIELASEHPYSAELDVTLAGRAFVFPGSITHAK